MNDAADPAAYIAVVLTLYVDLPGHTVARQRFRPVARSPVA